LSIHLLELPTPKTFRTANKIAALKIKGISEPVKKLPKVKLSNPPKSEMSEKHEF